MPRKSKPTKEYLYKYRVGQTNAAGFPICGAKTSERPRGAGGRPCEATALMSNGRCRIHSGLTPNNVLETRFSMQRWRKYLPQRLAERAEANLADKNLLDLQPDIAMLDARLSELMERLRAGGNEGGAAWERARKALCDWRAAGEGTLERAKAFSALEAAIDSGATEWEQWAEIRQGEEQRRKMSETQVKNMALADKFLRAEEVMLLMSALGQSVKERFSAALALYPELLPVRERLDSIRRLIAEDIIKLARGQRQVVEGEFLGDVVNASSDSD